MRTIPGVWLETDNIEESSIENITQVVGYIRRLIGVPCCLELDNRFAVHVSCNLSWYIIVGDSSSGGEDHNEHDGHDAERTQNASTKRADGSPLASVET